MNHRSDNISELFRERVRSEMERQGTSISETATRANISFVHLSRVLSGKAEVSLKIAEQIAGSIGVSLSELISRDGFVHKPNPFEECDGKA